MDMNINFDSPKLLWGTGACLIGVAAIFLGRVFAHDLTHFDKQGDIDSIHFEVASAPLDVTDDSPIQLAPKVSHLFGIPVFTDESEIASLPETALSLQLAGTFTSDNSAGASALVAEENGQAQRYFVGDILPGDAELVSVHPDSIVIRRNLQDELLKLPRFGEIQTGPELMYPDKRVFLGAQVEPANDYNALATAKTDKEEMLIAEAHALAALAASQAAEHVHRAAEEPYSAEPAPRNEDPLMPEVPRTETFVAPARPATPVDTHIAVPEAPEPVPLQERLSALRERNSN